MNKRITKIGWIVLAALLCLSLVVLPACGGGEVKHPLTIGSTAGGSTTPIAGTRSYAEGTEVDIVATADAGYVFTEWTGDTSTIADVNDPSTTIIIKDDYSITANFGSAADVPTVCGGLTSISAGGTPMDDVVQTLLELFVLVSLPAALWMRRRWNARNSCNST